MYPPFQWPLVTFAAILLGGCFFMPSEQRGALRRAILADPVFLGGVAFLALVVIQSVNSGYAVMWDNVDQVGMPDLPPKWLPWSVEPNTAAHMFNWFFPAFTAILAARHVFSRDQLRLILYGLTWNAALLAAVGLAQGALGAEKMLGLWTIPHGSFFSTFGYVNHGGAFFYLHAALAAGLAHHAIKHHAPAARLVVWIGCFTLCLAGAFGSLSRAAGCAALILVAGAFGAVIQWAWKRSKGNQIVNIIGVACVVALAGLVLYFGSGEGALATEIEDTLWGARMEEAVEGRTMQLPSAWSVAKDFPVFGCGGWGYRWVALLYIPVEEWPRWQGAVGKANVHCDPLQFLCEFGVVGSLLMAGVVGVLAFDFARAWRKNRGASATSRWIALGLLLIFIHGFVDLPFRCPAILIAWCFLLAALPKLAVKGDDWEEGLYE